MKHQGIHFDHYPKKVPEDPKKVSETPKKVPETSKKNSIMEKCAAVVEFENEFENVVEFEKEGLEKGDFGESFINPICGYVNPICGRSFADVEDEFMGLKTLGPVASTDFI